MNVLQQILRRLQAWLGSLPQPARLRLLAVLALASAATLALWGWAAHDPMVLLFQEPLDAKTSSAVVEQLKSKELPYRLEPGTDRIYVPRSHRDALALELRGSSLLDAPGAGLELLDETKFGSTRFMEHVRWVRALQGEIERQINILEPVIGSKVLLSMPEERLFESERVDPSASVYVELKSGMQMSIEEGRRVATLVAAAVPGLRAERVEILDSELRVIHQGQQESSEFGPAGRLAELQRQYERYYQAKVESLLERIVGPGRVVAQIAVDLDESERSVVQRELDGEKAVTISTRTRESSSSAGANSNAGGVPGTTANLPELNAGTVAQSSGGAGSGGRSEEADEVANVDVPEKRTTLASLPGAVLNVTAAVLVDGAWTDAASAATSADAAGAGAGAAEGGSAPGTAAANGSGKRSYVPRTEEELRQYAQVVASALGTDVRNVTVVNRPFAEMEIPEPQPAAAVWASPDAWLRGLPWALALLALVLSFAFVVRPLVAQVAAASAAALPGAAAAAYAGAFGLPAPGAGLAGSAAGALGEGQEAAPGLPPPPSPEELLADFFARLESGGQRISRAEVQRLITADISHSVSTLQRWIGQGP
jgi:flagellar M-ring protein FliF